MNKKTKEKAVSNLATAIHQITKLKTIGLFGYKYNKKRSKLNL